MKINQEKRDVEGEHEALCAYDSKVPCNDAEHGESLGNIDIADTLFNGFALAFGGRR